MPVNLGLAHISDLLFTTAIALYSIALVSYCAEYAFGRRGRVARTSGSADVLASALVGADQPVLVGALAAGEAGSVPVGVTGTPAGPPPGSVAAPAGRPSGTDPAGGAGLAGEPEGGAGGLTGEPGGGAGLAGERGGDGTQGRRAEVFGRVAVGLTVLGWGGHIGSIALRALATHRPPWGNMYEFSSAVGLVAVGAFLIALVRQPQVRHLGMFVMLPVILLMFLAGTVLYAKAAPLVPALRSYWLAIHVTAAVLATGIFMLSAVVTMLYLVRERWERAVAAGHQPSRFPVTLGWRLPAAETLDRVAYRTIAFGFPIWTFGIIAGAMWAEAAWGRYWGWDPKETWAFIAWLVYAAYLHARATAGWRGVKAARINLLGFSTMVFNFFVVNIVISGLHSYAGLN